MFPWCCGYCGVVVWWLGVVNEFVMGVESDLNLAISPMGFQGKEQW